MHKPVRRALVTTAALGAAAMVPFALAHFDDSQPTQSYRQSYFALVASNFGPMGAMVKGEMPWDDARMKQYAEDLETLTELDFMRGFAPGSEQGQTRAKPDIWENTGDFEEKFADLRAAVDVLEDTVDDDIGDRKAIAAAVASTGKACKACHDEYKSKDYLY